MNRRDLIKNLAVAAPAFWVSNMLAAKGLLTDSSSGSSSILGESIAKGPFKPTWDSLTGYKTPDWFRDAKFGIWAHWGPQCQPERGDWYARKMYIEGSEQYKFHVEKYGHPSKFGFKDVINEWKAENWNPNELVALYKKAGAQYFFALANHHDNFDLYNSKYHRWNSMNLGPKKDLIGGWAKAAKEQGVRFGVSVHAAHAWTWYETAQGADKSGSFANINYDVKITKADGKGKWWAGYDPQELYVQNHALSAESSNTEKIHKQWDWGEGANVPSKDYCEKFLNRTIDLINKYDPDLIYFDDSAFPLWPISDAGLKIAAHFYNRSIKNKGKLESIIFGKILDEKQRKCMVWDIERGQSNQIEPLPWQTDTCIGKWHYDRRIFEGKRYKSAKTIIQTLADVVSKNGNLLLNVPVRGDGTIDAIERAVVEEIGEWMAINSESIFSTRPWKVFGEGPAMQAAAPLSAQGFNEGKGKPFGVHDIRFTTKGDILYAIVLGWPKDNQIIIKSLAKGNPNFTREIQQVTLLGGGELKSEQTESGLIINVQDKPKFPYAVVFKV